MALLKEELKTYCELFWWNMGRKTLSYKGDLKGLLASQKIKFRVRKTENDYIFKYYFSSPYGIKFTTTGSLNDFESLAKQFVQMELVRMGDKSMLYVNCLYRPIVTVNH